MIAARWVGRALVAGLATMLVLNLVWVARHLPSLRPVAGGARAPAFTLPLQGGGEFRLAPGRVTMLDFWASWCAPCREELPSVDRLAHRYRDRADVVAVNVEDADATPEILAYLRGANLTLPLALRGGPVAEQYHVESLPHVVVIDSAGTIHRVFVGPARESDLSAAIESAR